MLRDCSLETELANMKCKTDPLEEGKRRLEEVRFDDLYKRPPTMSR